MKWWSFIVGTIWIVTFGSNHVNIRGNIVVSWPKIRAEGYSKTGIIYLPMYNSVAMSEFTKLADVVTFAKSLSRFSDQLASKQVMQHTSQLLVIYFVHYVHMLDLHGNLAVQSSGMPLICTTLRTDNFANLQPQKNRIWHFYSILSTPAVFFLTKWSSQYVL